MKRLFETAECEVVRNSIFWVLRYEKHENQMKGCAVELKVCDWPMNTWILWAGDTVKVEINSGYLLRTLHLLWLNQLSVCTVTLTWPHEPFRFTQIALLYLHLFVNTHSKPTVSIRPSVPSSGSHKCLRFGLWLTLCTINDFCYLLTCLFVLIRDIIKMKLTAGIQS